MTWARLDRVLITAIVAGLTLLLMPPMVGAAPEGKWIDQITAMVADHQELAKLEGKERAYDAYLGQLAIVRAALVRGDREETYGAMNHLMDMLVAKENGIPGWSAKTIFDFCGRVTPVTFHDAPRHAPELTKGGFDYWDDDVFDPASNG